MLTYEDLLAMDPEGLRHADGEAYYRKLAQENGGSVGAGTFWELPREWTPEMEARFQRRDKPKDYEEMHQMEKARNIMERPPSVNSDIAADIARRFLGTSDMGRGRDFADGRQPIDAGALEALLLMLLTRGGM